ncbi:MAG: hypothetical protein Q8P11_03705 [bacterium]|nr:hypothetical protein [bacterium]
MLTFSFKNSQISASQIKRYGTVLAGYVATLQDVMKQRSYDCYESSILLSGNRQEIKEIQNHAKQFISSALRYVIVIGIGGSNLGAKAIYDALLGSTDTISIQRFPKLICLDTCDVHTAQTVMQTLQQEIVSSDQYIINVISKSGSTAETVANTAYFFQMGAQKLPEFEKRVVITTDEDSVLWKMSKEKGYTSLAIPKKVGGRYSAFSSVGLFPLACLGIDIAQVCKGAQWALRQGISDRIEKNPSAQSAIALVSQYTKRNVIHDTFFFAPALETLGKWYRQLFAESLGKVPLGKKNTKAIGITPTVSIGSTDLHSMAQLYLANPTSRFTTFVSIAKTIDTPRLNGSEWTALVPGLQGQTLHGLMKTIYQGVVNTYTAKKMPFVQIDMKECSAFTLGAFMQMKMLEVMYCAHVLGVNAFDQPHVEIYKKEVRKLLK